MERSVPYCPVLSALSEALRERRVVSGPSPAPTSPATDPISVPFAERLSLLRLDLKHPRAAPALLAQLRPVVVPRDELGTLTGSDHVPLEAPRQRAVPAVVPLEPDVGVDPVHRGRGHLSREVHVDVVRAPEDAEECGAPILGSGPHAPS